MTPCERLGYKVGDAFVAPRQHEKIKKGDIIFLQEDDGTSLPFFAKSKKDNLADVCFFIEHEDESVIAKPYKPQTEAEKRGAKFGVMGTISMRGFLLHGKRFVFVGVGSDNSQGNETWLCLVEGNNQLTSILPSCTRLDHEPEYKDIPFKDATHEQRMNVDNLVHISGEKITEIFQFKNGCYAYTMEDSFIREVTEYLKVRVPA